MAGSGLVGLAVAAGLILFGGGSGASGVAAKMADAGCTFTTYPALPNQPDHSDVPTLATRPKWNSFPPTSGPHYGETATHGQYDDPIPLARTLHNLEHGAVVIHYGKDVPAETVAQLRDFYNDDPQGLILAPLPRLNDQIALSAWYFDEGRGNEDRYYGEGQLAKCTDVDKDAFNAYLDAFRYKGRERFPADRLSPGSQ